MAAKLFKTYSTTTAHWHAVNPGDDTPQNVFPLGDPSIQVGADMPEN